MAYRIDGKVVKQLPKVEQYNETTEQWEAFESNEDGAIVSVKNATTISIGSANDAIQDAIDSGQISGGGIGSITLTGSGKIEDYLFQKGDVINPDVVYQPTQTTHDTGLVIKIDLNDEADYCNISFTMFGSAMQYGEATYKLPDNTSQGYGYKLIVVDYAEQIENTDVYKGTLNGVFKHGDTIVIPCDTILADGEDELGNQFKYPIANNAFKLNVVYRYIGKRK